MNPPQAIWTIGHSRLPLEALIALLGEHGIEAIADVRRFPGSRANPQYGAASLAASLPPHGLHYLAMPELGGRRSPRPDSPNTVWRNLAFRGYADYMATPAYAAAFERLLEAAVQRRTAIMCSEALWWRCHRSLIADDLKARGVTVLHIAPGRSAVEHPFTSAARVVRGRLVYGGGSGGAEASR